MSKDVKSIPEDKDLSTAIPPMPPSFRSRIQKTCENLPGRQPIALRRASIAATAVLAAVALLILSIGFQRPESFPDTVTPLGQTATNNNEKVDNRGEKRNTLLDTPALNTMSEPLVNTLSEPKYSTPSEPKIYNGAHYYADDHNEYYHYNRVCNGIKYSLFGPMYLAQANKCTVFFPENKKRRSYERRRLLYLIKDSIRFLFFCLTLVSRCPP